MRRAAGLRLWYEARIVGAGSFAILAVVVMIGVLSVGALLLVRAPGSGVVWMGAQFLAALAAGMSIAAQGGHDVARELHLTLPTPYRRTLRRRCALLGLWTAALSLAAGAGLVGAGVPLMIMPPAALTLLWLALLSQAVVPLICFGGVGLSATLLLQSSTGSAAFLAGLWVALLFLAIGASLSWRGWLLFYSSLLLISVMAMLLSRRQLHNADRLLRGAVGE